MTEPSKKRCDAYLECAYYAEGTFENPEGTKRMNLCGNCWHGTYKWDGWKPVPKNEE